MSKQIDKLKKEIASMEAVYAKPSTSEGTKKILKRSIETAKGKLDKLTAAPPKKEEPKKEEPKKEEPAKPKAAKKPSTPLSKLMRRVKGKGYEPYRGKKVDLERDGGRKAKAPGKKVSKTGRTYWESRPNRIDVKQKAKKAPYLKDGGTVPSVAYGDMVYNTLESALSSIKTLVKPQNYSILKKDGKYMITTNRRSGIFSKEGWENFGHVLSNNTLYRGTIGKLEYGGVAGYDEGGESGKTIDSYFEVATKSPSVESLKKNNEGDGFTFVNKDDNDCKVTVYHDEDSETIVMKQDYQDGNPPDDDEISLSGFKKYLSSEKMKNGGYMAGGGDTSSPNVKFMKWYVDWSKGVDKHIHVSISIPNEFSSPVKDDSGKIVMLDVIEKKGDADAKKYMDEILKKADEFGVSIYLQPIPRTHNLKSQEHKDKITKDYLVKYYGKFGFENTDGGFMVRAPKMAGGGEIGERQVAEKLASEIKKRGLGDGTYKPLPDFCIVHTYDSKTTVEVEEMEYDLEKSKPRKGESAEYKYKAIWISIKKDGKTLYEGLDMQKALSTLTGKKYFDGGYMAKGGATEHGLMVGDMIVLVKGSIIGIIDENGEPVSVDIETGDRRSAKEKVKETNQWRIQHANGEQYVKKDDYRFGPDAFSFTKYPELSAVYFSQGAAENDIDKYNLEEHLNSELVVVKHRYEMEQGGKTEYAGGGNVMKDYEKVEGTNYELKIQVYYDKGGMNYFTSRPEQRGYYASVTPVQVERRGNGIMVESYAAFSGVKMLVLPVQRQSPKAEKEAKEKAMQVLPELKEAIKERIKSKMGK